MEYFATFYLHTVAARFSHARSADMAFPYGNLTPQSIPLTTSCSLEPQCAQSVGSVMKLLRQAVRP